MEKHPNHLIEVATPRYRLVMGLLLSTFFCHNIAVYTVGTDSELAPMSSHAMDGAKLWQENNCTACHQLYGLGGYLGPDLTNVISNKGPEYAKAFFNSGIKAMPKFNFTNEEKDALVAFLHHVDQTGFFPNNNATSKLSGWVELEYKTAPKKLKNE